MPEDVRCPVCGRPAGGRAACGECGWTLNTRPRAGTVTAAIRQDFDARLRQAREGQAARDERALRAALGAVLATARPGQQAPVIVAGQDGIEVSAVYLDDMGTPLVREAGTVPWTAAVPGIAAGELSAILAEGAGPVDSARIAALVRDRLPPDPPSGALVVAWPAGSVTVEAAAQAAARVVKPAAPLVRMTRASRVPVAAMLAGMAARAPVRRPYYLLTASISAGTGEVRLRPRQLFGVGATPGAEQALTWRRLPGDVGDKALAVFAGNGRTDWPAATPLAMFRLPAPVGLECTLRAVLDGPGRVRITEPAGAVTHPGTWRQVFGQIPRRVVAATDPVDLVCAIDLAGDMDTVLRRKALARDLIELLGAEYPDAHRLQVAIVTCTDHVFGHRRGQQREPVTLSSGFGAASEALSWLSRAEGADRSDRHCTPVEDLLNDSAGLLADSARSGRRPRLLTLAGRPPHPYPQPASDMMACPLRLNWRLIVADLDRLRIRYAVVVDDLPRPRTPARADWDKLGPAGQYSLPAATARAVAECLGLVVAPGQRVPLPLTDDYEGAS